MIEQPKGAFGTSWLPTAVTPSQAAAAAALEHRMLAIHVTSNLVVMNATPG